MLVWDVQHEFLNMSKGKIMEWAWPKFLKCHSSKWFQKVYYTVGSLRLLNATDPIAMCVFQRWRECEYYHYKLSAWPMPYNFRLWHCDFVFYVIVFFFAILGLLWALYQGSRPIVGQYRLKFYSFLLYLVLSFGPTDRWDALHCCHSLIMLIVTSESGSTLCRA